MEINSEYFGSNVGIWTLCDDRHFTVEFYHRPNIQRDRNEELTDYFTDLFLYFLAQNK